MKCNAYLLSEEIDLRAFIKAKNKKAKLLEKGVCYFSLKIGKIFCFDFGVLVFWNISSDNEELILEEMRDFIKNPLKEKQYDHLLYTFKNEKVTIKDDKIKMDTSDKFAMLAISYGIAQSLKLSYLEEIVQKMIENIRTIPEEMSKKGRITLSANKISKMRGKIFVERSYINLHFDFLDNPEFFWEHPEYEKYYLLSSNYFEIKSRVDVLNKKLNLIHEVFEMLSDEQKHRHSSFLEWIIILLILFEIVFGFFK